MVINKDPEKIINVIISLIILIIYSYAILSEKFISPKEIVIADAHYLISARTKSERSSNTLLIINNSTYLRSSCEGLSKYCGIFEKTELPKGNNIYFLKLREVYKNGNVYPYGIITKITVTTTSGSKEVLFHNKDRNIHKAIQDNNSLFAIYFIGFLIILIWFLYDVLRIFSLFNNHRLPKKQPAL